MDTDKKLPVRPLIKGYIAMPRIMKFVLPIAWILMSLFLLRLLLPILAQPQYFAFKHRSTGYYAEFTRACDSLLALHPLGTNKLIELSGADPSIPSIIREVRPSKIQLSQNSVGILGWGEGGHEHAVGIDWGPDDQSRSNVWVLRATFGSQPITVYVAPR